jgi:Ca2+/Na+ antiporter
LGCCFNSYLILSTCQTLSINKMNESVERKEKEEEESTHRSWSLRYICYCGVVVVIAAVILLETEVVTGVD